MNGEDDKSLLWKLPVVKSDQFGKVGPAFGIGAGCGLGFGLGLLGGSFFNLFLCTLHLLQFRIVVKFLCNGSMSISKNNLGDESLCVIDW